MRYTLRWISKDQQVLAWERIEGWGYPADLDDFGECVMVEVGDGDAFFWFEFVSGSELLLHFAAAPDVRSRFMTRRVVEGVYWAAEFLGAERLWVITDIKSVGSYVQRLGWEYHSGVCGWFKRIRDGQSGEESIN